MTQRKDPAKINPLIGLPALQALIGMPVGIRHALAQLMAEIKDWAEAKAQHCWKQRKAPLAAYYMATGVYASHIGRALRKGLPKEANAAGLRCLLDVSTSHLTAASLRLLRDGMVGGIHSAPAASSVFVIVPPGDVAAPPDLDAVLKLARRSGATVVRLDAAGEVLALPVHNPTQDDGEPQKFDLTERIFSQEVRLVGTVYVRAKDKSEAKRLIEHFVAEQVFEFDGGEISGKQFNDPELPEVSFSPAFTGEGLHPASVVEEVE